MTPWRADRIVFLFIMSATLAVLGAVGYVVWPPGFDHVMRARMTGSPFLGGVTLSVYTGAGLLVRKVRW